MQCSQCNRTLEQGQTFCPGCGTPVPGATAQKHKSPLVPSDPGRGAPEPKSRFGQAVLIAVVLAAVGTTIFMINLKSQKSGPEPPDNPPPRTEPAAPVSPERPGPVSPQKKTQDPMELRENKTKILETLIEFWKAEKKTRYRMLYRYMTRDFRTRRLDQYYPEVLVVDNSVYADLRESLDHDILLRDAGIWGEVEIEGPRAVAMADVDAMYQGEEINWRYRYVLIKGMDDNWRVDGIAAGEKGPYVASANADFDDDGQEERLEFSRDFLHNVLRWEVIEPGGEQAFVFEMTGSPSSIDDDKKTASSSARNLLNIFPMDKKERDLFAEQFEMWANSPELSGALRENRPGFLMTDGFDDGVTCYVIYIHDGYQIIYH